MSSSCSPSARAPATRLSWSAILFTLRLLRPLTHSLLMLLLTLAQRLRPLDRINLKILIRLCPLSLKLCELALGLYVGLLSIRLSLHYSLLLLQSMFLPLHLHVHLSLNDPMRATLSLLLSTGHVQRGLGFSLVDLSALTLKGDHFGLLLHRVLTLKQCQQLPLHTDLQRRQLEQDHRRDIGALSRERDQCIIRVSHHIDLIWPFIQNEVHVELAERIDHPRQPCHRIDSDAI